MKFLSLVLILGVATFIFIRYPETLRIVKSVWLILQTAPYSQVGSSAGKIIIVGDSTAYGTGVSAAKDSIAGRIGTDFPAYRVETWAKNGQVIAEVVPVLEGKKITSPVDLLLLQIGANDILRNRSMKAIEADIRHLLTEAKKYARQVIFMSSGNIGTAAFYVTNGQPDQELERRTRVAREIFIRVAAEQEVTYIDLFEENVNDLFLHAPELYFSIDGLHPSAAGYDLWYQKLVPEVHAALMVRS